MTNRTRPYKAWTPNLRVSISGSGSIAEMFAYEGARQTKTYGFTWDEANGKLLTCYQFFIGSHTPLPMLRESVVNVLALMAVDKTASPENRRTAKRILKAIGYYSAQGVIVS